MAGLTLGQPLMAAGAVPVGAFAGALTEELVAIVHRLWADQAARVERFADTAAREADSSIDDIMADAAEDPRRLELLARAVEAASRSLDDWKIDLLARTYVHSTGDDSAIDDALVLTDAIRQLEVPHLRLLAVLSKPGPVGLPVNPPDETPRPNVWRAADIAQADPGLEAALPALIGKLEGLGLIYNEGVGRLNYESLWTVTELGKGCSAYLLERGRAVQPESTRDRPRRDFE